MRRLALVPAVVGALSLSLPALADPPELAADAWHRHRVGLEVFFGGVTNDPFVSRRWLGTGVEVTLGPVVSLFGRTFFAPDYGSGDWKPITQQLINENKISPDISKIMYLGELGVRFDVVGSPRNRVRMPLGIGIGTVHTADDLNALQAEDEPEARATERENHLTSTWHLGLMFRPLSWLEVGAELSSYLYIETVNSTTLEFKNNQALEIKASVLLGGGP